MKYLSITGYRWLTLLLCLVILIWDNWRAFRQTIYRPNRAQRWALFLPASMNTRMIWIHAVSVGETQACAPLLRAVLATYPQYAVLLTHMTPTGRSTGAALFADEITLGRVQQCYLPYDIWGLPERFFKHFKPCAGMILETEVWPNTVTACHDAAIPLGLANARMSDKTYQKTFKFRKIAQQTFNQFSWIAAQSEQDAQRIAQLCTTAITVTGNLKFDVQPDISQLTQGTAFKASQQRRIIALASTREGEEALLLEALKPWLAQFALAPLVLLIPRHPKRAPELIALLKVQKFNYRQRSLSETPDQSTQVYLCDTLGEMWFYYGASDIAIIGGGWLPHGGQNFIEPCMAGCLVVVGPNMFNFTHATALALQAGAVIQCGSTNDLSGVLNEMLNIDTKKSIGKKAKYFVRSHTGSTDSHIALLRKTIANKA